MSEENNPKSSEADEKLKPRYTEVDLREAFKAGWKERNRDPGLRKQTKRSLDNALRSAIGGGRFNDVEYVKDTKTYNHSIWTRSTFFKDIRAKLSGFTK